MLLLFYVLDLLSNVTLPSIIIIVYNTNFQYSNVTSYNLTVILKLFSLVH